ncbi:MAG: methanogenesis marker protein Mmp4/MtxX [archaeon]|nr:methanogenesis marker protein Mmp4/MtxX [archaeon]
MFSQTLFEEYNPKNLKIGMGWNGKSNKTIKSKEAFGESVVVYTDSNKLIEDLYKDKIDAAIRGDMSSSAILPRLKETFKVNNLERVVIFKLKNGKLIISAPVGIDEGWTVEQKYTLATRSVNLMESVGIKTKIAVMSGGRKDDIGRCPEVDKTIYDALKLVQILNAEGYNAYHAEILLENAINDADIIIAPDGISGNIIFRSLHFICGAKALGAPVVNIDKIFVDTSRAKDSYEDSIALAIKLARNKK